MKLELNTNAFPLFNTNLYAMSDALNIFEFDGYEELDDGIMEVTEELINDAVFDVIGHNEVVATGVRHPKSYNYNSDECDFTIEFDGEEFDKVKSEVVNEPEFEKYLKKYASYDGYISYLADNLKEFNSQEEWKQFTQVMIYKLYNRRREYQDSFYNMLIDWCYENLYLFDDGLM